MLYITVQVDEVARRRAQDAFGISGDDVQSIDSPTWKDCKTGDWVDGDRGTPAVCWYEDGIYIGPFRVTCWDNEGTVMKKVKEAKNG